MKYILLIFLSLTIITEASQIDSKIERGIVLELLTNAKHCKWVKEEIKLNGVDLSRERALVEYVKSPFFT